MILKMYCILDIKMLYYNCQGEIPKDKGDKIMDKEKIKQILKDEIELLDYRIDSKLKDEINGKEQELEFTWLDVLSFRKCDLDRILSRIEEEF